MNVIFFFNLPDFERKHDSNYSTISENIEKTTKASMLFFPRETRVGRLGVNGVMSRLVIFELYTIICFIPSGKLYLQLSADVTIHLETIHVGQDHTQKYFNERLR